MIYLGFAYSSQGTSVAYNKHPKTFHSKVKKHPSSTDQQRNTKPRHSKHYEDKPNSMPLDLMSKTFTAIILLYNQITPITYITQTTVDIQETLSLILNGLNLIHVHQSSGHTLP